MYFDSGEDGFPAFGIKPGSDIKSPYRLFLPEKLYPEFSIVFNFKLNSMTGGFLFAVVNPLENVSIEVFLNSANVIQKVYFLKIISQNGNCTYSYDVTVYR